MVARYSGLQGSNEIYKKNSITFGVNTKSFGYQTNDFYTIADVLFLKAAFLNEKNANYFITTIKKQLPPNGWDKIFGLEQMKGLYIQLPIKNNKIDFDFIERFMAKLESSQINKIDSYLINNGLNNFNLTEGEKLAIENYKDLKWQNFNLEELFGKSTRGRRLKSSDRISGTLPFVTAGEADEGVSDFIGNNVVKFSENTTTIDMFGSAKYRNYKYGGDDHIAVVHTNKLPKFASIFVTSAIHKSSYNGQFNYGKNFYAKDADVLDISLPVKDNKPDYETMETLISAIHKLVIKDVFLYVQQKKEEEILIEQKPTQ